MYNAFVIYDDRVEEVELPERGTLEALQGIVGGHIEAVPVPPFLNGAPRATCYVNEDGKYACAPNMAATDFMVPGMGLFMGDYIAGPLVIVGFDPETGEHTPTLPGDVVRRINVINKEAFG
jgi:hypothetical protein